MVVQNVNFHYLALFNFERLMSRCRPFLPRMSLTDTLVALRESVF
jgi:hypothetical protein